MKNPQLTTHQPTTNPNEPTNKPTNKPTNMPHQQQPHHEQPAMTTTTTNTHTATHTNTHKHIITLERSGLEPKWNLIRIKQQRCGCLSADMVCTFPFQEAEEMLVRWRAGMVSLIDAVRRRSKIAGKTDEIHDIWNDQRREKCGNRPCLGCLEARGLYD